MMQVSANVDLMVHQMDVKTAYLNAPIDTEIYMKQPAGYEKSLDDPRKMVCKVLKAVNGLRREGGVWPKKIDFFCLDIFYYLSYVGSGTFYRNEKSQHVTKLGTTRAFSVGKWLKTRTNFKLPFHFFLHQEVRLTH